MLNKKFIAAAVAASFVMPMAAQAKEHPMGKAKNLNGMEIAAVYLQPITMDKEVGLTADEADAHIELDIHANQDNEKFSEGWWIPYLVVNYKLEKLDNNGNSVQVQRGELMPMVADDGPHYGKNVKFMGPGNYKMTYFIYPPSQNKATFARHTDKETGVEPWFEPFGVAWSFPWAGPGEKGSY